MDANRKFTREEILTGLRQLYADWQTLAAGSEGLSAIRAPDLEAALDQLEREGMAKPPAPKDSERYQDPEVRAWAQALEAIEAESAARAQQQSQSTPSDQPQPPAIDV
jgi:hypothetical protein